MTQIGGSLTTGEVFAAIQQLLDRHDTDRSAVPAAILLEWVGLARSVTARVEAARDLLIAEADKTQAAERAKGTPLTSWLGTQEPLSRKEANSAVFRARRLAEHPRVGEAVASGRLAAWCWLSQGAGSMASLLVPPGRTSKCRCGPVECPDDPTSPMCLPAVTR